MNKYVIGDIHGCYDQFMNVLKQVNFDYNKDLLISLGDLCDRGPEPINVLDELFKIKNKILIRGNHDEVLLYWLKTGRDMFNGGNGFSITKNKFHTDVNKETYNQYINLLESQINYYIDKENRLFIHGGYDYYNLISDPIQDELEFSWNRQLNRDVFERQIFNLPLRTRDNFTKIFIGHTPTLSFTNIDLPFNGPSNKILWNLDTGCCFGGKLTLMNIDTEQFYQA